MELEKKCGEDAVSGEPYVFYKVHYQDDEFIDLFLTVVSRGFNEFHDFIKQFSLSINKEEFLRNLQMTNIYFNIHEDHSYPDENMVIWSNVFTTKHNLGKVVDLYRVFSPTYSIPYLIYSFEQNKYFIIEEMDSDQYESKYIPKIQEFGTTEFMDLLGMMKDLIEKYEEE